MAGRYGMQKSGGVISGDITVIGGDVVGSDPQQDTKVTLTTSRAQLVVDNAVRIDAQPTTVDLTVGAGQGLTVNADGKTIMAVPFRSVDSDDSPVTLAAADAVIAVDTSGGAVTINMPNPTTVESGRNFTIIDTGSAGTNAITVADSTSSSLINGQNSQTIDQNRGSFGVFCSGAEWLIH